MTPSDSAPAQTSAATLRTVTLVLAAANFVVGMAAFVVVGIQTPLAQDLGFTTAGVGLILTIYALAYAVLSPILVSLTGAIGRRRVLTAGMSLVALSTGLGALSPTPELLLAARVIGAAGAGLVTPVAAAVIAGLSPPETRGRALAAVFAGLTYAQVVGVPAGTWIAYTVGWRTALWVAAGLAAPCAWLIWTRVPAGLRFAPVSLSDLGRSLLDARAMLGVLFTASFLGSIYIVFGFLPPLLENSMGWGRDLITLSLVVAGIGAIFGNRLGGQMADRLGPGKTLMILCCAQAIILPVFSMLPLPAPLAFALVLLWNVAGWSFAASQQMRVIALKPEAASVMLALNSAAIYIGAAVGSSIGAITIRNAGLDALGWVAGGCAILALLHLLVSLRLSRHA